MKTVIVSLRLKKQIIKNWNFSVKQQAWSFKAIEKNDLRYWGNDGYHDDSSIYYRYDNFVANHKNVKKGDVVVITNRENILGVSIVDGISTNNTDKKRNQCIHANCTAKKIMRRKKIKPEWRCSNGHEFDSPKSLFSLPLSLSQLTVRIIYTLTTCRLTTL